MAVFLGLSLLVTPFASAAPITGEIAFVGLFAATGGSGPTDLAGATGIDFTYGFVAQAEGDFSAANGVIPLLSPVSLTDFTFDPFTEVDPLWAVGVFQFALQTLTTIEQGTNYLALAGYGTVSSSVAGMEDTAFAWSFSGDNSGGTLQLFTSTASALPEPSGAFTLALLALSLGGLCLWSRKNKAFGSI